jgi:hypothetical protein
MDLLGEKNYPISAAIKATKGKDLTFLLPRSELVRTVRRARRVTDGNSTKSVSALDERGMATITARGGSHFLGVSTRHFPFQEDRTARLSCKIGSQCALDMKHDGLD